MLPSIRREASNFFLYGGQVRKPSLGKNGIIGIATLEKQHFWPENPQSPEEFFVFPLFFAYFNLRSAIELAILPNGPNFFAIKMG